MLLTLLVAADLLALAGVFAWYLTAYQPRGGSFGGVMGQMMGSYAGGTLVAMPGSVWFALVGLIVVAVVAFVTLGYYLAFPEIRLGAVPAPAAPVVLTQGEQMSWSVLLRTSKPEEKQVLEVLAAHGGSYLQKFVVKETGLSKLKTHRIVSRLAERGVVQVERSGNTNQVTLAPWAKG